MPSTNHVYVVAAFDPSSTSTTGSVVAVFDRASDALEKVLGRMEVYFPRHKYSHHVESDYDSEGLQTMFCSYSLRSDGYHARKNVWYTITETLLDKWNGI